MINEVLPEKISRYMPKRIQTELSHASTVRVGLEENPNPPYMMGEV
jgi:hypothetical protein